MYDWIHIVALPREYEWTVAVHLYSYPTGYLEVTMKYRTPVWCYLPRITAQTLYHEKLAAWATIVYAYLYFHAVVSVMPNRPTYRRRYSTVELSLVGGVNAPVGSRRELVNC